jgi:hypothetical protein
VRVFALRIALRLLERERPAAHEPDDELWRFPDGHDLKRLYRDELKAAFAAAVAALPDRERAVLRYHLIDGLAIDAIGAVYQVHRATAARWLSGARDQLAAGTRRALMQRLKIDLSEVDSLMRLPRATSTLVRPGFWGEPGVDHGGDAHVVAVPAPARVRDLERLRRVSVRRDLHAAAALDVPDRAHVERAVRVRRRVVAIGARLPRLAAALELHVSARQRLARDGAVRHRALHGPQGIAPGEEEDRDSGGAEEHAEILARTRHIAKRGLAARAEVCRERAARGLATGPRGAGPRGDREAQTQKIRHRDRFECSIGLDWLRSAREQVSAVRRVIARETR